MSFDFSNWPPEISEDEKRALHLKAATYALSHGLVYLPVNPPSLPASAIHAPFSLFPSPIPRSLFGRAQTIQSTYNILYARIAMDIEFLDRVMGADEGVGRVDEFMGQLWSGWKELRDQGIVQSLQLGLFRSDYLLHALDHTMRQVEFNTVSSSFGALSERAAAMHRYIHLSSPHLNSADFPPNHTTSGLAEGLATAHKAYGSPGAHILFVVQAGERNVFDQRWLEYELLETHGIPVIRSTFDEINAYATLDNTTSILRVNGLEISTIYFRAGYTPNDFPSRRQYLTRFMLEKSKAIKCPSLPLQLAGGKKVQQVLSEPGVLERFLSEFSSEKLRELRGSWMGMWALDGKDGIKIARARAMELVLKPQREGGGNNVYKEAIPPFLDQLPEADRPAWIAMELIVPPEGLQNYLVRSDGGLVKAEVVSELGIFGWALFGGETVVEEKQVGWLVRTKGKESNEGGVATGFSVLDSIVLVDD